MGDEARDGFALGLGGAARGDVARCARAAGPRSTLGVGGGGVVHQAAAAVVAEGRSGVVVADGEALGLVRVLAALCHVARRFFIAGVRSTDAVVVGVVVGVV